MQRRQYLALTVGALTLAGCTEDTGDNSSGGGSTTTPKTREEGSQTQTTDASDGQTTGEKTEETTQQEQSEQSFGPKTFSGSGTTTSEEITLAPGPITGEYTHSGSSNFIVTLVTLDGESYEDVNLTNLIGDVEGSQIAAVSADGGYKLNVEADGEWEIVLNQPANPSPKSLPVDASGSGPSYIGPFEFNGPTTFDGSHSGNSNFIVEPIPIDPANFMGAIFNKIGAFQGSTTARVNGVAYLNIVADGEWTLSTTS